MNMEDIFSQFGDIFEEEAASKASLAVVAAVADEE